MADTTGSAPSSNSGRLAALPPEIFDMIVPHLELEDLKSLRLCRTNNDNSVVRLLFRRIRLSALKADRHSFLSVASRPHLSRHVQILEWLLYPVNVSGCARWFECRDTALFRERACYHELAEEFINACWAVLDLDAPRVLQREQVQVLAAKWDHFRPFFQLALANMPALDTFRVQYMESWRPIGIPCLDSFLSCFPDLECHNHDICQRGEIAYSVPFEHIRLELGRIRTQSPLACVSTLSFSDTCIEINNYTNSVYYRPIRPPLWRLYGLNVLLKLNELEAKHITAAVKFTLTAPDLKSLTVIANLQRHQAAEAAQLHAKASISNHFFSFFRQHDLAWDALTFLALGHLEIDTAGLVGLLRLHASTLRTLAFKDCGLTIAHIDAIATVPGLQLESFESHEEDAWIYASPDELILPFLRKHRADTSLPSFLDAVREKESFHDEDLESFDTPDITYDSLIDTTIDMIDLTSDYHHIITCHRHLSFRFGPARHASRWHWGRAQPRGPVHYWPATDGSGEPTCIWDFPKRGINSNKRFGDGPRAVYHDWKEGKGPKPQPTPFGYKFRSFDQRDIDSLGDALTEGRVEIPSDAVKFTKETEVALLRCGLWTP